MLRYYLGAFIGAVYLLNFTFGTFEIPDFLPIVGNLDEFAASALLLNCLRKIRGAKDYHQAQQESSAGQPVASLTHEAEVVSTET